MTLFLLCNIVIVGVLAYVAIGALLTQVRYLIMRNVIRHRVSH